VPPAHGCTYLSKFSDSLAAVAVRALRGYPHGQSRANGNGPAAIAPCRAYACQDAMPHNPRNAADVDVRSCARGHVHRCVQLAGCVQQAWVGVGRVTLIGGTGDVGSWGGCYWESGRATFGVRTELGRTWRCGWLRLFRHRSSRIFFLWLHPLASLYLGLFGVLLSSFARADVAVVPVLTLSQILLDSGQTLLVGGGGRRISVTKRRSLNTSESLFLRTHSKGSMHAFLLTVGMHLSTAIK
jgi:hypothetical protein